ncbi:cytochrome c [Novosphingobium profundi]|uniref:c-type cytochrome n=1 Tax=Novosphingobium profundi TaxID=1774954 RepID=UPI001BDB32D3|nr:cytochrome c [Novosphingobium profundi]MBT0670647.1 cytochrome c [Novosphingobium profundi]
MSAGKSKARRIARVALPVIGAAVVLAGVLTWRANDASADDVADGTTAMQALPAPDPASVARGRAVAIAADCSACHTRPGGGAAFAGGYPLETPFGTIMSSNITPDRANGIGNWTEHDFFKAVRHGQSPDHFLYPAMPYTAYVQISDEDMHDLWAYIRSLKPVSAVPERTDLPFPFNLRILVSGWNLLFFDNAPFQTDASHDAAWNRGRYLTDALAHCGTCHTSKNFLGADRSHHYLAGGTLSGWHAPDLTGSAQTGLASWSEQDLISYLQTGSNDHAVAAGPMAEAVEHSTQKMPAADLGAIAGYLKSLPAHSDNAAPKALAASDPVMQQGALTYHTQCSACHTPKGQGIAGMATHLADNAAVRAEDPTSLIHAVLMGAKAARTDANPTGAGMPSFGWRLSDEEVAAALTHVRNTNGNAAAPVTANQVASLRKSLDAREAR